MNVAPLNISTLVCKDNVIIPTDTTEANDDNIFSATNTINRINNAQFWRRETSNVIVPKMSSDYIKCKFFAIDIRFINSTKRHVNDIELSKEISNSDNTLSTTAFVHKCISDVLSNYYNKTESHKY